MRKLGATLIVGVLLALVFAAVPQRAAMGAPKQVVDETAWVSGGVSINNTTGVVKTDFHMKVMTPEVGAAITCNSSPSAGLKINAGTTIDPDSPNGTGSGTQTVEFTWSGLTINPGDNVLAAFRCTQWGWNSFTVKVWFTDSNPLSSSSIGPSLGWDVTANRMVYLQSDQAAAVDFSDLRYQFPTSVSIASMMSLAAGSSTGTLAPVNSGTVAAAPAPGGPGNPAQLLVDNDPPLAVGQFLTARAVTQFHDPGYSSLHATVAFGHQQPPGGVGGIAELPDSNQPLPTSEQSSGSSMPIYALFAGIGLVAVAGTGWYARRRRHS